MMERRTFLETAAAAVGGLLTCRPPAKRAPQRPSQWEWEVGDWRPMRRDERRRALGSRGRVREWEATATVTGEEMVVIVNAPGACNGTVFCGAPAGRLQVESIKGHYIGDGLVECQVRLRERQRRQDRVYVFNSRMERVDWFTTMVLVNFHDIFRGSHSVTLDPSTAGRPIQPGACAGHWTNDGYAGVIIDLESRE